MQDPKDLIPETSRREPWNNGKLTEAKPDRRPTTRSGLVKLSSIGRDGGLIVARVMPLRLHGSIARLLLPAGRCVCGFGDLAMPSVDPPRSPR